MGIAGKIYFYKMTHDTGAAPCVKNGLLTLAICKPSVRSSAVPGDIIFGFGSRRFGERLIYIAVVTEKLAEAEYYKQSEYAVRPDCIYEIIDGKARVKKDVRFHQDGSAIMTDIGPGLRRANVLISRDFRYFGKSGTGDYKTMFPAIGRAVSLLKRGHRVNHPPALRSELTRLKNRIWEIYPDKVNGRPIQAEPCPGSNKWLLK